MIEINDTKWVKTINDVVESLFHKGGTATGLYKIYKRKVIFSNLKGNPFAALIMNKDNDAFFVSCFKTDGKIRYSFGLDDIDKRRLGLNDTTFTERRCIADRIRSAIDLKRG